ncbi:hypothetical protein COP2_003894 [Malus domestica]
MLLLVCVVSCDADTAPAPELRPNSSPFSVVPILLFLSKPLILCRISDLHFLVDPTTDEVFAKMFLVPIPNEFPNVKPPNGDKLDIDDNGDLEQQDDRLAAATAFGIGSSTWFPIDKIEQHRLTTVFICVWGFEIGGRTAEPCEIR